MNQYQSMATKREKRREAVLVLFLGYQDEPDDDFTKPFILFFFFRDRDRSSAPLAWRFANKKKISKLTKKTKANVPFDLRIR